MYIGGNNCMQHVLTLGGPRHDWVCEKTLSLSKSKGRDRLIRSRPLFTAGLALYGLGCSSAFGRGLGGRPRTSSAEYGRTVSPSIARRCCWPASLAIGSRKSACCGETTPTAGSAPCATRCACSRAWRESAGGWGEGGTRTNLFDSPAPKSDHRQAFLNTSCSAAIRGGRSSLIVRRSKSRSITS